MIKYSNVTSKVAINFVNDGHSNIVEICQRLWVQILCGPDHQRRVVVVNSFWVTHCLHHHPQQPILMAASLQEAQQLTEGLSETVMVDHCCNSCHWQRPSRGHQKGGRGESSRAIITEKVAWLLKESGRFTEISRLLYWSIFASLSECSDPISIRAWLLKLSTF